MLLLCLSFIFLISFANAQIVIDGDMLDWAGIPAADQGLAAEELGDMLGGSDYDLNNIYITSDDSMFYMRITIDPLGSFVNGYANGLAMSLYLDTDLALNSGLNFGWWTNANDYLLDLSEAANGATSVTILNNIERWLPAPTWPTGWDSVGQALVALDGTETEIEIGIPLGHLDASTNIRPVIDNVGAWDWANPDQFPNDNLGADPAYMVDYNLITRVASTYQAKGPQIDTPIAIDGDMFDWAGISVADVDEIAESTGDMPTGPEFDVNDIWITSDSNFVYVRVGIDPTGTFSGQWSNYANDPVFELWFDTNVADTVGLGWEGFWILAGDYKVNLQDAYNPSNPQSEITLWKFIGDYAGAIEDYDSLGTVAAAVNSNDNEIEVAVPRDSIMAGTDVRLFVYSVGNEVWDNEEYFPNDQTNDVGPSYVLNYNFITGASVFQRVAGPTAIDDQEQLALPTHFDLEQNYPNPFNPSTTISFSLPQADRVNLTVFDVLGKKVAALINNQPMSAGRYSFDWNGVNDDGTLAGTGIYFYQLNNGQQSRTLKMMLMK